VVSGKRDILERVSWWLTLATCLTALFACVAAPLLAISWSKRPFPGFMVEPTLVVNSSNGEGWSGRAAGFSFGQLVVRIAGQTVATPAEYDAVIANLAAGQQMSIFTRLPDGTARLYRVIKLIPFPRADLLRMFWLPYFVGLAYFVIGAWIYRVRGNTRPGRALAFFCFCVSAACTLYFDMQTTHTGSAVWTAAIAMLGGALLSLALRFPEEWHAIGRRPWILGVPYGVSIVLAVSGLWALNNASNPWAYVQAWGAAYRYTALGIIVFLATMFYQAWASKSLLTRRQARIVLLGSALAFLPIVIWFLSPLFGVALQFNPALFLPTLVIFPLSVALAIFRYRLLEVDTLVNRTVFYGIMTAILAGVASGTITLCQKIFITVTGEKSDMALVIATLILVAAFEPVKSRMRSLVDSRLKEAPDNTRDLRAFGHDVHRFLEMSDPTLVTQHLLEEVVSGLRAQSGSVSLHVDGRLEPIHTIGRWRGEAWLSVPLESEGKRYGLLVLGPRTSGESYTRQEGEIVAQVASEVAGAVRRAVAARAVLGPQRIGVGRAYAELEVRAELGVGSNHGQPQIAGGLGGKDERAK
jgi:hypothetical protein